MQGNPTLDFLSTHKEGSRSHFIYICMYKQQIICATIRFTPTQLLTVSFSGAQKMVEVAAIVAGWFTPTSLFVLLNIVIATIFFTSAFGIGTASHHGGDNDKKSAHDHQHSETAGNPQLFRAPSLFSRVTSFNFGTHFSNHHHHHQQSDDPVHTHSPDLAPPVLARAPSLLSRVASFGLSRAQAQPCPAHTVNVPQQEAGVRIESARKTESEEGGGESRGEEKKVEKVLGGGEEEREGEAKKEKKKVVARQKKKTKTQTVPFRGTDDEVDAKADDFIHKFKQQLKMQRLESLLRYRSPPTATATATATAP